MNEVYVVFGENVQGEDIYKWPVKAYLSDKKALEHRDKANEQVEEMGVGDTDYFIYAIELDATHEKLVKTGE